MALGPDQVDALVEVRLRRQQRLTEDEPLRLDAVVTEAALRLQVGGADVIRAQLRKIAALAQDNVQLRVIPLSAGARGVSTGAFTLFTTGDDTSAEVAFTESAENTTRLLDGPLALRRLGRLQRKLSDAALSSSDSLELAERIEKEMI